MKHVRRFTQFILLSAAGLVAFIPEAGAQTVPPYFTDFEVAGGFTVGNLNNQSGWQVTQGTASVDSTLAFSGSNSVLLAPSTPPTQITHAFGQPASGSIVYLDFYALPSASAAVQQSTLIDAEGSSVSLVRLDTAGHVLAFNGDGSGGGHWIVTGKTIPLDGNGQATGWVRFTIRQDYSAKKWDLYVNAHMVAADLGFRDNTKTYLSLFKLTAASAADTYMDEFYAGADNPLFVDNDNDGMEDAWETAHGLDPSVNDRNADHDSDGLTNVQEYVLGTDPSNASTKGDGITDGWKVAHGLDPLGTVANTDPGNVGRTVTQSFQQSLSPWPIPLVPAGLQFWLRASAGVTQDSNGKVSAWQDVSGHAVAFAQSDAARLPQWVASALYGQPAIQFDGTTFLKTTAPLDEQAGSNDVTVIAVSKPAATQPGYSSLVDFSSDTSQGFVVGQLGGATNQDQLWFMDAAQTGWYSSPAAASNAGQVNVISVVKNGATAASYLNGVSQGTSAVPQAMLTPIAALAVGNRASGSYGYNGQIAEVLVYNRALSDAERAQIEQSLKTQYVNPDSDGNGLPDAWEQQYLGAIENDPASDPGGVGRTLLQSFQQGLSPWPAPLVASGLRTWFRASMGLSKDVNNKVSLWRDLSGNASHVTQSTDTTRQPLWAASAMNGLPAVQFDGNTFLKTAGPVDEQAGSTDVTVIAVAMPAATQPAYASLVDLSSDTARGFVLGQLGGATNQYQLWFMDTAQSGWYSSPAAGTVAGQVQVISVVKSGATAASYLNGVSQGSSAVPQTMLTPTANLAVGNRASGNYGYNGQIAEVLVYNRALTDAERSSIELDLQAKYINPDSDGNGLPNAWEMQYLGTIGNDANSDPGSVGRTLLQSYQLGLSPWPDATVADGLRAWYRADLGVTKDANNLVSSWVDLSGNGGHVVQSGVLQPAWIASAMFNNPAVQFDGTTFLKTSAPVDELVGSSDVSVIAVAVASPTQNAYSSLVDLLMIT